MTREKLDKIVAFYDAELKLRNHPCAKDQYWGGHIRWMLNNMPDDLKKAGRWLGFIQGVLWMRNMFSIEQMKEHNRE